MTAPGRRDVALWAVILGCGGCGEGRDVHLGSVAEPARPDAGTPSSPGTCGTKACAEHHGSRVFVLDSAAGTSPDAFDDGTEVPPGVEPDAEPALFYPSDETLVPYNGPQLRFAWLAGRSAVFALDFSGPNTSVRIVTGDLNLAPTDEQWAWIVESNRGATLNVVLRGLDAGAATTVRRAGAHTLSVSQSSLEGTVYYWSTGSQGLMRARPTETTPERFFTPPASPDAGTCTGCHTVSRDGKRVAAGYDKNQLAEFALGDRSVLVPLGSLGVEPAGPPPPPPDGGAPPPPDTMPPKGDKPPPLVWSTFSPDGTLLLTAGGGKLRLSNADTGAPVGADQGLVALPMGVSATHPDWSPRWDYVAVTLAGKGGDKQTEEGSIAVIPYAAGAFGAPEVLVPSAGDQDNNFFPSFSPDARFIAYVNARGGSQEAASARLRLLDVATKTVHELTRLNERVGADDGMLDLGNTMPSWGSFSPGGTYWLSFSSLRAYADLRAAHPKQDQLWIAGIDPSLDDVSFPAFWAPFQSIGQGNHRAFWVPAAPGAECSCLERCGNGRDDDCDGTVDEADCAASCAPRETCGDGRDDDCDCVPDDCSDEICDDGADNDGDGKTDGMDRACGGK